MAESGVKWRIVGDEALLKKALLMLPNTKHSYPAYAAYTTNICVCQTCQTWALYLKQLCLSNPVLPKHGKHKFAKMCHESGKIFEYRNVI